MQKISMKTKIFEFDQRKNTLLKYLYLNNNTLGFYIDQPPPLTSLGPMLDPRVVVSVMP